MALNPIIKFTTLFGLLAVELAVSLTAQGAQVLVWVLAAAFFAISAPSSTAPSTACGSAVASGSRRLARRTGNISLPTRRSAGSVESW